MEYSERDRLVLLPSPEPLDAPSVGEIKSALHELAQTPRNAAVDRADQLREAYALLRSQAAAQGVDPDRALQTRRAKETDYASCPSRS